MSIVFFGRDFSDPPAVSPKSRSAIEARSLLKRSAAAGAREFCSFRPHTSLTARPRLYSLWGGCTRRLLQTALTRSPHTSHKRDCAVFVYLSEERGGLQMKPIEVQHKLTYWQRVFLQSKVNGASYNGESLPGQVWCWPENTYLQRRLQNQQQLGESAPPVTQKILIQAHKNKRH